MDQATEYTRELEKALGELKRVTGLSLAVTADTPEDAEQTLSQLKCLCTAYKEKYNRTDFLQSLMTGGIPSYEIPERAARLHITADTRRVLFLLEARTPDEVIWRFSETSFLHRRKPI